MLKLLLIIGVLAAIYFFFFKKGTPLSKERNEGNIKDEDEESTMVACESCGTYISTKEALVSSGKFYCSEQCRDKV
jgi:uncharacterized protein